MGTDPESVDVVVCRRVTDSPWWAGFARVAERVVSALPQHRDSRSGRRNAAQMRAVILVAGIASVVLWDSPFAPLGLLVCGLALVVPISESRKRQLVASLRTARRRESVTRTPGRLVLADSHIELWCGDEQLRRLRRKGLERAEVDDGTELRAGGKDRDRLLLVDGGPERDRALWVEGGRAAIAA